MTELLVHEDGIQVPDLEKVYKNRVRHDPRDLAGARAFAESNDRIRLGVFFRDPARPRYEVTRRLPAHTAEERAALLNAELDKYAV